MTSSVSGFYTVKDSTTLTFYVTTGPLATPVVNQAVLNLQGIQGGTKIISTDPNPGVYANTQPYNWSFDFQVDKAQSISGVTPVTMAQIVPMPFFQVPDQYQLYGTYVTSGVRIIFYSKVPLPKTVAKGWLVKNFPGTPTTLEVFSAQPYPSRNVRFEFAGSLVLVSQIPGSPLPATPITGLPLNGEPILTPANVPTGFVAQTVTLAPPPIITTPSLDDDTWPRHPVLTRDLDVDVPGHVVMDDVNLNEKRNKGFSAGGVLALDAIGPQENYTTTFKDFKGTQWDPAFPQYTQSVLYHQRVPFSNGTYIQQTTPGTAMIELRPPELGDLFSNMHLQVTLPPLNTGNAYAVPIGRALFEKVEFIINDTVIETIYDDWLVARDQLFLDYDEQYGMLNMVNGGSANTLTPSTPLKLFIPLEFFFCRRHSSGNRGRERLKRPYFPACAIWNQKIYIRFTFRPQNWFTNCPTPIDIIKPALIIESIRLTNAERLYYRNKPMRFVVPTIKRESTVDYNQGRVSANLTANFPVRLLVWFIRNKNYEEIQNSNFYDVRYLYGYASQYVTTAVPLAFPTGTSQYIDAVQTVKITMNNADILDTFANGAYCSILQPMDHGLSVPQKNIYVYSFGLNVSEYNQGGYIDFSKLNSRTSNITLSFLPELAATITQYSLYLFYMGYSILEFQDGFGRLAYV
jgi:Large eukaryotic DNA virus major capsid protein/Major capsid protein N-terminus